MSGQSHRTRRRRITAWTEHLERRVLFAAYTASTVTQLVAAIDSANSSGGADTITLAVGATFSLAAVNNNASGATGLPQIAGGGLTILGGGATIERSDAAGTPAFRLFDVAPAGSLSLTNLTLQGGLALGATYPFAQAAGGAILNQGALSLVGVAIQNNAAEGPPGSNDPSSYFFTRAGGSAAGGAVYSNGTLTMQGCTIRNNRALGGRGGNAGIGITIDPGIRNFVPGGAGGSASGGGTYVAAGNASVDNCIFVGNGARGGDGGTAYGKRRDGGGGGAASGGGLHVQGAGAAIHNSTITSNSAVGGLSGAGAVDGHGIGGGIYIGSGDRVGLDAFTLKHAAQNKASTGDRNIAGLYELLI